jgi:uncharacterized protein YbjT (DUF2867 family)
MPTIAIIGATGMLGQPVTRAFVEAGWNVTILARNEAKARQMFGASVNIIVGDVQDAPSLRALLKGQRSVYMNLSVDQNSSPGDFQPEREGLQNVLAVAREQGVQRVGYLSSLVKDYDGFDWWSFDIKRAAVETIRKSGLAYSIFCPSTFMETFDSLSAGSYRQGNRINLAGLSKHKMYLIAGADYGRMVVRAFELNNGSYEYVVQGREGYTADEAAKLFAEHYKGAKLSVATLPFGILKFLGRLSKRFNYVAHIVEALNNYPEKFAGERAWQELGEQQISLMDYIRRIE